MKKILLICLIFQSIISVSAQDTTVYHYDQKWKLSKPKKAVYKKQVVSYSDSAFKIIRSTIDNNIISVGLYKSLNPKIEHGIFKFYDSNGNIQAQGNYKNGFLDEKWIYKNNHTRLYDTIDYTGILELYKNPEKITAKEVYYIVEEMPQFGNSDEISIKNFQRDVESRTCYPLEAKYDHRYGTILIQFLVGVDGEISSVELIRGEDKDLIFEALRVVRDSPQWIPGKQRGEIVNVLFVVPVYFF